MENKKNHLNCGDQLLLNVTCLPLVRAGQPERYIQGQGQNFSISQICPVKSVNQMYKYYTLSWWICGKIF